MRTIRTTFATMLMGLALVAFQFDAQAQTRRSTTSSQSSSASNKQATRTSGTVSRQPSGSSSKSSVTPARPNSSFSSSRQTTTTRPSTNTATRPSGTVSRQPSGSTGTTKPSTTVQKPTTTNRPAAYRSSTGTQTRPSTGTQVRPTTGTQVRPSTGTQVRPSTGNQTRPATGSAVRPTDNRRPVQVTRPADRKPTQATRPTDNRRPTQVTRPVDRKPGGEANRPNIRPDGKGDRPDHKPSKPVQIRPDHRPDVHRVHPRDRDFMHYSTPSYFWSGHNHYYGHRVRVLPTHVHRHTYFGVTYYCYNDIWYRPYNGYYVVCRPPFGTTLAANLIADMAWSAVRLSYYYTVANTYSQINENNQYIAEQNAIIAQNNAVIAQQNAQIAAGQQQAQVAYSLATQLGLVQSYAAAGSEYYYQDGVFYVMDANGEYKVIVPPAGALVEILPEDFDMVTLADGNEYYKVDDTIYRVVVIEGKPYFEVLGQLYV